MQGCTRYAVSFSEMIEDQDSLFRQIGECVLGPEEEPWGMTTFSSPEDSIRGWVQWMSEQGYLLEELPWCRLRGLGLVYIVTTPCGGEDHL